MPIALFKWKEMRKTQFLSISFLANSVRSLAPQEPVNRKILRLFDAKFYKSDRLLAAAAAFGVYVESGGTLCMENGVTVANCSEHGVFVNGIFTMNGGTISGNTSSYGGGVYVFYDGIFVKTGGSITADNSAGDKDRGNVVYVISKSRRRNSAAGPSVNMDSRKDGRAGLWQRRLLRTLPWPPPQVTL